MATWPELYPRLRCVNCNIGVLTGPTSARGGALADLSDAGDGAKFLDRDPDIFNVVLKCLRNPALDVRAVATDMGASVTAVSAEIEFLGLQSLLTCTVEKLCSRARSRRWTTWPIP